MYDVLATLGETHKVLDIGSSTGSFPVSATKASVVRVDLDKPAGAHGGGFAQANAEQLPFADRTFDLVIANHSLEHFDRLIPAISEIGRVLKPSGSLIATVPDASTLADKLYRWLGKGGGHVNAFTQPQQLPVLITKLTGIPLSATVVLHSGFSILNRRNTPRMPRKLWLLGGGYEEVLRIATFAFRAIDKRWGTRLSVYGWAYYFGSCRPSDTVPKTNVCIRCGAGTSATLLHELRPNWFGGKEYTCPHCGTRNLFTLDPG